MAIKKRDFGKVYGDQQTTLYEIAAGKCVATITDLGATLVDFSYDGIDVNQGYDTAQEYIDRGGCYGAIVGRNANRIGGASFVLNGKEVKLEANDHGKNSLHSGKNSYYTRMWKYLEDESDSTKATFYLFSPDGDQGFPGNLQVKVTYKLTPSNELVIRYKALCDSDTVFNPTNHSYFNMNGNGTGTIYGHTLKIKADYITEADKESIPTGALYPVAGTPFDFRKPHTIGERINDDDPQIRNAGGYDHNFVVADQKGELKKILELKGDISGLIMEVSTDLPGIQIYTSNYNGNGNPGKRGSVYGYRTGVALETQFAPDHIHHPEFAHPVIKAGEPYETTTVYKIKK